MSHLHDITTPDFNPFPSLSHQSLDHPTKVLKSLHDKDDFLKDARLKELRNTMRPLSNALHDNYFRKEDVEGHHWRKLRSVCSCVLAMIVFEVIWFTDSLGLTASGIGIKCPTFDRRY